RSSVSSTPDGCGTRSPTCGGSSKPLSEVDPGTNGDLRRHRSPARRGARRGAGPPLDPARRGHSSVTLAVVSAPAGAFLLPGGNDRQPSRMPAQRPRPSEKARSEPTGLRRSWRVQYWTGSSGAPSPGRVVAGDKHGEADTMSLHGRGVEGERTLPFPTAEAPA